MSQDTKKPTIGAAFTALIGMILKLILASDKVVDSIDDAASTLNNGTRYMRQSSDNWATFALEEQKEEHEKMLKQLKKKKTKKKK